MIGIVDLGMGNLRSVANAVVASGEHPLWVRRREDLDSVSHLILPGVGSFAVAAARLDASGLRAPLKDWARAGRPLLGICLGMQLLAEEGLEGGLAHGLGVVRGRVERFDSARVPTIPHVGWNEARLVRRHPVLRRVKDGVDFYYVHSFHFVTAEPADVVATVEYGGGSYTSVVAHGGTVGVQFHPEKSQVNGLRLVENFCQWDGKG